VTPSEKRLIAAHLAGCPGCRAKLESIESLEFQIRQHVQQRALRVAAPASGWQALQERLAGEVMQPAAQPLGIPSAFRSLFSRLAHSGWRLAAAVFVVLLALLTLTPAVRAQVQAQIQEIAGDWFHFGAPGGQSQAEIGGFGAPGGQSQAEIGGFGAPGGQSQAEIGGFGAFTPYHATYLPEGFQLSGMGGSSAPGVETITLGYNQREKFVDLAQSAGPELEALPQGELLRLKSGTAVFVENFASSAQDLQVKMPGISIVIEYDYTNTNLLVWDMGELRVQMISNLTKDEMVRIAESLAPMQSGQLPAGQTGGGFGWGALEFLIILLFGWAGIALGLVLAALGLLKRSLPFGIAGLLLGLPFSLYLLANPSGWPFGLVLPLFLGVSAYACSKPGSLKLGWTSLILAGAVALGIFVLTR
jgi:hypothetical protein